MEHSEWKPNRLQEYDYNENGAYFVTICTQNRCKILSSIVGDDAHIVPSVYGRVVEKYIRNVPEIEKYVLMPDHIHMIFRIDSVGEAFRLPCNNYAMQKDGTGDPSSTLGNILGWYKYQVSREINCLQKTPGEKVFQRSYYDHVIRNQQDYEEIWEYIESNPKRWLLKKRGWE